MTLTSNQEQILNNLFPEVPGLRQTNNLLQNKFVVLPIGNNVPIILSNRHYLFDSIAEAQKELKTHIAAYITCNDINRWTYSSSNTETINNLKIFNNEVSFEQMFSLGLPRIQLSYELPAFARQKIAKKAQREFIKFKKPLVELIATRYRVVSLQQLSELN